MIHRRRCTVHAAAEGYEARNAAVSLQADSVLTVRLRSCAPIAEREPNHANRQAQPIRCGAPVRLKIAETGDRDRFRFRLDHEAELTLRLDPPNVLGG